MVSLVYQRGAFHGRSVELTASAFACYAVGLTGMGLVSLFTRVLSTVQWNRSPLLCSMAASVLNLGLDYLLVETRLQHAGLALAASLAFAANAVFLAIGIQGWLKRQNGGFTARDLVLPLLKVSFCAFCSLVLGHLAGRIFPFSSQTLWGALLRASTIGVGVALGSLLVLLLFPMEETQWLKRRLTRRKKL